MNPKKVIPFPCFENTLISNPNYEDGRFLFRKKIRVTISSFDEGVWIVHPTKKSEFTDPFIASIQIQENQVISMQCNCEKEYNCEHTICALLFIKEKIFYDDDNLHLIHRSQHKSVKKKRTPTRERFIDDEESVGTDSFIDDAEYPLDGSGEESISDEDTPEEENQEEEEEDLEILPKVGEEELTLQQEFTCQICLEEMEMSVIFPCYSHSICYACAVSLFEAAREEANGSRRLSCPTCGNKYYFRIFNVDGLKGQINKSMRRMLASYKDEKKVWEEREARLKGQLNDLLKNRNLEQFMNIEEEKEKEEQKQEKSHPLHDLLNRRKSARKALTFEDDGETYLITEEKEEPLKDKDNIFDELFARKKSARKILTLDTDDQSPECSNSGRRQDLAEEEEESFTKKKRKLNGLILD